MLFPLGDSLMGLMRRAGLLWICSALYGATCGETRGELSVSSLTSELILGLAFGVPIAAAVAGLRCAMEAIDNGRGQNVGALFDVTTDQQQSAAPAFAAHAAVTALVASAIIEQLVRAVGLSIQNVALGSAGMRSSIDLAGVLLIWTGVIFTKLLLIAVPFLAICCLVEFGFGALAVLMPGLSLQHEIVSLKQSMILFSAYSIVTLESGFAGLDRLVYSGLELLVRHVGEAV